MMIDSFHENKKFTNKEEREVRSSIMGSNQLDLIRQYCDTSGVHLDSSEKDLLCMILENASYYNGFTSSIYTETDSGRDYRDTWTTATYTQYRINIDSTLSIDQRYRHTCSDGYDNDRHGVLVNEKCKSLAKKIKEIIDTKSSFADWLNNQIVRDQLKFDIKVCLIKNGYPPQYSPEVFRKVMEQVENSEENQ